MRRYDLQVNHPLNVDSVKVYLIGHGYAPVFRITDGTGRVVFDRPVPFIPVSLAGLTSEGVIKVPDAHPQQLGFAGVFLPTTVDVGGQAGVGLPRGAVPAAGEPGLLRRQPGHEQRGRRSRSTSWTPAACTGCRSSRGRWRPGQSIKLPDGAGHAHLHRLPAVDQPGHHL